MAAIRYFKERGFKQINYHTLSNDYYVVRLDKEVVTDNKSGKKSSLE